MATARRWASIGRLGLLAGIAAVFAAAPAGAIETAARQAILLDYDTGALLFEKDADVAMAPASMTKIMTLYMLFQRLEDGRLSLDDTLSVSKKAWRKGGSKMFVEVDSRVAVEDLIRGIVVQSGNDASIVVAEGLAGSEKEFADEMTATARALGLTHTTFRNATGWPDPEHVTTARDLARLAVRTIADYPNFYHYYGEITFTYNDIRQGNRNPLLYKNLGVDGLKTGHTSKSGYGLTASAVRNGRRLVLVLNGLDSVRARARESERLLDWGFREFDNYPLFKAGETVTEAAVWLGDAATLPLVIERDLTITLTRGARGDMRVETIYESPIAAPIEQGASVGRLVVTAPGFETLEIPLIANQAVERLGFTGRITSALGFLLWGAPAE
jgi:D-alanyl-D-alanine carboxypeptidase (penicillin-binding protein 5/6)